MPARPGSQPGFVEPMAAKLVTDLPVGNDWIYEVKLDGYRCLAIKKGRQVQLRSRRNKDLSNDFPQVADAIGGIRAESAVVDGEIVALDPQGRPAFQLLQRRARVPRDRVLFFAFDLLHEDGQDLSRRPLAERKDRLAALVNGSAVQLSESLPGSPAQIVAAVRRLGLEGVIAKRSSSAYEAGRRSGSWVKLKLNREQELVVGGYKPDGESFQSLLVGYYDAGALRFAGRVRAGLTPYLRAMLMRKLKPIEHANCPFVDLPTGTTGRWGEGITAADMKTLRWVKPLIVAQVSFVEWPEGGLLRHSQFVGLREDKRARQVSRDEAR